MMSQGCKIVEEEKEKKWRWEMAVMGRREGNVHNYIQKKASGGREML
jgi:hypothetical protein